MPDIREELKRILDIKDEWILSAFYSDPAVSRIHSLLLERWERAGRRGDPLEYATDEEARTLLQLAKRYVYLTPQQARAIALGRMGEEERREKRGFWSSLLRGRRKQG